MFNATSPPDLQLLETILSVVDALIIVVNDAGHIVRSNHAARTASGYSAEELAARPFWEFLLVREEAEAVCALFRQLQSGLFPCRHRNHWRTKSGDLLLIEWSNSAVCDTAGKVLYVVGTGTDVTERVQAEERYRDLCENTTEAIHSLDAQGRFLYVNPAWTKTMGYTAEEARHMTFLELVVPERRKQAFEDFERFARGEKVDCVVSEVRRKDGTRLTIEGKVSGTFVDGKLIRSSGIYRDITDQTRREALLRERNRLLENAANSDPLTGISNRRHFDQELDAEWERSRRSGNRLALFLFDLDHFKLLNDTLGHGTGDLCLTHFARVLAHHARRAGDLAARLGGEEFVLLLRGCDLVAANSIACQILQELVSLGLPNPAAPSGILTSSCGVAVAVAEAAYPATILLRAADSALYQAKDAGRNRWVLADGGLERYALELSPRDIVPPNRTLV